MIPDEPPRLPPLSREQQLKRQALLSASRDHVADRLTEVWCDLLAAMAEDLRSRGDVTDEREARQALYGLADKLAAHGEEVGELFASLWQQDFDQALDDGTLAMRSAPAELQLVDLGDFDEDLAVQAFARKIDETETDAVYAVGRRIAALGGGRRNTDVAEAAAPRLIGGALRRALISKSFTREERLHFWKCLLGYEGAGFARIYPDWNEELANFNVLPDLKRTYGQAKTADYGATKSVVEVDEAKLFALLRGAATAMGAASARPPAAAPVQSVDTPTALAALDQLQRATAELEQDVSLQADSLRRFRASDVGQGLGQLDAITVDIVAMLFDMIYQDEAIADPVKVLFGRLQIPLLKVALADRSFFSSRAHPARRFLEQVSHAAIQLGRGAGREDALFGKLTAIIERLQREFEHDAALFDELCSELANFLALQNRAADLQATQAMAMAQAHERREEALAAALQALQPYIDAAPKAIGELLANEWCELLARAHIAADRTAWDRALATAEELQGSSQIAPGGVGRNQLVARLPALIKRIQEGFDVLGVEEQRRLQLIDGLFALHATLMRGSTSTARRSKRPAPPVAAATASTATLTRVDQLKHGDWIELSQAEGVVQRFRISWVSDSRGVLLLTNRASPKGIALTPQALALALERGRASIVPTEPIFERAVGRALGALSDEDAAKISLDFT